MKLQNTHDVGIYCRLSRDDNNGNLESMSIGNQKQMLMDYVKEKGWNLQEVYVDDGFSGTNFDRPDFKRLLRDISIGTIDCVITKDLSRLGRNYSKVGYYTEEFFIEQGIRFIAINDSFDTLREEENEIAPFKNVLNEWYPRDISKKVRQVKKAAARQGKFMGSQAPYGYKKDPVNKHVLIIDEYAAAIARRIFYEYASGCSARMIGEKLNQERIDSPRFYNSKFPGGQTPRPEENNNWGSSSIMLMLANQAYIGNMVHNNFIY
jgi:site-specific DNA recombinase